MNAQIALKLRLLLFLLAAIVTATLPVSRQQRGQYLPGRVGSNSGILASPLFTYPSMEINHNTDTLHDPSGTAVPPKPTANLWVVEDFFTFVPNDKFRGGNLGFTIIVPSIANGSLTLKQVNSTYGLADTWVQPFTVGWHLKRADFLNNIGSGYSAITS